MFPSLKINFIIYNNIQVKLNINKNNNIQFNKNINININIYIEMTIENQKVLKIFQKEL
ncbi:hypothetical protein AHA02nite_29650 [Alkalibacillus haloalkaliphilus]|uniref:Uncharacterized protein n=1 Tax=Alkalibacillus haloalkaliphilus TaxID=94136 RepID=A0A511W7X5_9BACI|nr:hypothetical protein AHA02nite_29650 [Alkalibacillus haloalkaliphilus]